MTTDTQTDTDMETRAGPTPVAGTTWRRLAVRWRRTGMSRKLAVALAAAAVASGIATVAAMTGSGPGAFNPNLVLGLLYLDVALLLALGAVITRRLLALWAERRSGRAGSRLQSRLVVLFSIVAVTPAILVAVFAAVFLNFGIQGWFSDRVRTAVEESRAVAQAYLVEHRQTIRADILAMANDLNQQAPSLMRAPGRLTRVLDTLAAIRSLPEAMIVDGNGRVIARSALAFSLEFDLVPEGALREASDGDVVILTSESDDRVRAVVRLDRFVDAYLLVGRFVEPAVVDHIEKTERAFTQYKDLEQRRKGFQLTFVMIFGLVALLLLLAAAWTGLMVAGQITGPISGLISAAERVRRGDMSARVDLPPTGDELGSLARAFNRMTGQLEAQRHGLVRANHELDERRRFTETVLAGVSAGVIGLDAEGRIQVPNRSASLLLATDLEACVGEAFADVVPEMAPLLDRVRQRPDRLAPDEVSLIRDGRYHALRAVIAAERRGDETIGYVVTFDDVTELLSAQRKAAWADVARRIAHEIKNPLTPIQLSAERLKRKYLKQIATDPETFTTCTDTIIRHVEDIGRMVDEFSSFARMPQPVLQSENASELCRQAVFSERTRASDIDIEMDLPEREVRLLCDARQVGRALTNLLKNAAESIERRCEEGVRADSPGHVLLTLHEGEDGRVRIEVRDDGAGFPADLRDRLTEPYVTSRAKGTGLGLAIVKKIMEDHNGDLILQDREGGGACVTLEFPPAETASGDPADGAGDGAVADDPMTVAAKITHGP